MTPTTMLPPPGDPRRDLLRAAEETRSLGLCMIGFGALMGTCILGNLSPFRATSGVYLLSMIISCGAFGVFYTYAARMMRAARAWAPTATLAVSGAQAMWMIGYLGYNAWRGSIRGMEVLALPSFLWLTALGVVAVYSIRAARAIRLLALDVPRFEIQVAPPPASPKRPVPVLEHVEGQQQVRDGVGDDARAQALRIDEQQSNHQRPDD
jgi:hypothetical protein